MSRQLWSELLLCLHLLSPPLSNNLIAPIDVVVVIGTIKDIDGMLAAGSAANKNGKPIVFDPVACGASELRRTSADG